MVTQIIANSNPWEIARVTGADRHDSRAALEKLGFKILDKAGYLFYSVEPPNGWTMSSMNVFWTAIRDERGVVQGEQYFDNESSNREAFINLD